MLSYHDSQLVAGAVEKFLLVHAPSPHSEDVHVGVDRRLQQVLQTAAQKGARRPIISLVKEGRKERKQQLNWDSHGRGHLVLEGVGRDPVGALEENGPAVDAEVEAQPCGALQRLLDQLHRTEEHLQAERGEAASNQS